MESKKTPDKTIDGSLAHHPKQQLEVNPIADELATILEHEDDRIDVNILLVNIERKAASPDKFIAEAKKLLALTREFERDRLKGFKEAADAVIDVKARDPDEIEKRASNRARRYLKLFIALICFLCVLGSGLAIASEADLVISGMLVALAALSMAMLGPLASGESISSTDVVRIMNAIQGMMPKREPRSDSGKTPEEHLEPTAEGESQT